MQIFRNTKYKKERVYRVKTNFQGGAYTTGSGFFISADKFLTCFHVIFKDGLRDFRKDQAFLGLEGADEHAKLQTLFANRILSIEIEIDGQWLPAQLENFDEKFDIAQLQIQSVHKVKICEVDWNPNIDYGEYVIFGGFPQAVDYEADKAPFATHEGIVSSFPDTQIAGEKYQHVQINSINLGGNSGAPLFRKSGKRVIGIINGNRYFGAEQLLFQHPNTTNTGLTSIRVPVSIAYATSSKVLKEQSAIADSLEAN